MFELLFYSIEKKLEERSDIIIRYSTLDVRCSMFGLFDDQCSSFKTTRDPIYDTWYPILEPYQHIMDNH
jgi:hypothetical protein